MHMNTINDPIKTFLASKYLAGHQGISLTIIATHTFLPTCGPVRNGRHHSHTTIGYRDLTLFAYSKNVGVLVTPN